jgi:hypothetical protein
MNRIVKRWGWLDADGWLGISNARGATRKSTQSILQRGERLTRVTCIYNDGCRWPGAPTKPKKGG